MCIRGRTWITTNVTQDRLLPYDTRRMQPTSTTLKLNVEISTRSIVGCAFHLVSDTVHFLFLLDFGPAEIPLSPPKRFVLEVATWFFWERKGRKSSNKTPILGGLVLPPSVWAHPLSLTPDPPRFRDSNIFAPRLRAICPTITHIEWNSITTPRPAGHIHWCEKRVRKRFLNKTSNLATFGSVMTLQFPLKYCRSTKRVLHLKKNGPFARWCGEQARNLKGQLLNSSSFHLHIMFVFLVNPTVCAARAQKCCLVVDFAIVDLTCGSN